MTVAAGKGVVKMSLELGFGWILCIHKILHLVYEIYIKGNLQDFDFKSGWVL